jgi:hypothetical protein
VGGPAYRLIRRPLLLLLFYYAFLFLLRPAISAVIQSPIRKIVATAFVRLKIKRASPENRPDRKKEKINRADG